MIKTKYLFLEGKNNLTYAGSPLANLKDQSGEFCWNLYTGERLKNLTGLNGSVYRIGGGSDKLENSPERQKKLAKKNPRIKEYSNLSESPPSSKCSFLSCIMNRKKSRRSSKTSPNETLRNISKSELENINHLKKLDISTKSLTLSFNDDNVDEEVKEFLEQVIQNCSEILSNVRIIEFVNVETQTSIESLSESKITDLNSIDTLWSCDADISDGYTSFRSLISSMENDLPLSLESTSVFSVDNYEDRSSKICAGSVKMNEEMQFDLDFSAVSKSDASFMKGT